MKKNTLHSIVCTYCKYAACLHYNILNMLAWLACDRWTADVLLSESRHQVFLKYYLAQIPHTVISRTYSWLYAGNAVLSQIKDKQPSNRVQDGADIFIAIFQSHMRSQSKSIFTVVNGFNGAVSLWNTSRSAFNSMSPQSSRAPLSESDTEASKALIRFQRVKFTLYTRADSVL